MQNRLIFIQNIFNIPVIKNEIELNLKIWHGIFTVNKNLRRPKEFQIELNQTP